MVSGPGATRQVCDIRILEGLPPLRERGMVGRDKLEFSPRDPGFS